jgi:hypothetical protein
MQLRMKRLTRIAAWLTASTVALAAATSALLAFSPVGQNLVTEASSRSPQELIRYLKRRLQGHNKLEAVLLPPLHAAQRHFEREPPAGPLPTLGKGQQAQALKEPIEGITQLLHVDSPQAIRQALRDAKAGTRIVVGPGLYPFDKNLGLGNDGRSGAPIVLSAEQPGTVWFEFEQLNGIVVDRPHWVFENLDIRGVCANPGSCEHAFHVVGRGAFTTIRNNRIIDFNAHVKINGSKEAWPDHGLFARNTLANSAPRSVYAPVVAFDLVGANHWRVQDNLIRDIVHTSAKQTTYGIYMKGASQGGRIERNLVICSSTNISKPGVRVGISFGGGGTGPAYCRDRSCASYEHRLGLAANNIVAHCNDTGFDVNRSSDIHLAHNTVINTSGIALRGNPTQVRIYGNLYEGRLVARDGAQMGTYWNEKMNATRTFSDADALALTWRASPDSIPALPIAGDDFNRLPREATARPGAYR